MMTIRFLSPFLALSLSLCVSFFLCHAHILACSFYLPFFLSFFLSRLKLTAEYDADDDVYLTHRIAQIVHLKEFIAASSHPDHLVFVAADLNSRPFETAYQYLMTPETIDETMLQKAPLLSDATRQNRALKDKTFIQLHDAWLESHVASWPSSNLTNSVINSLARLNILGATFGHPTNVYSAGKTVPERIDYILYLPRPDLTLVNSQLVFTERLMNNISMSDHNGVAAEFQLGLASNNHSQQSWQPSSAYSRPVSSLAKLDLDASNPHLDKADSVPIPLPPRHVFLPSVSISRPMLAPIFSYRKDILTNELFNCQVMLTGLIFGMGTVIVFHACTRKHISLFSWRLPCMIVLMLVALVVYTKTTGLTSELQLHGQYIEKLL